jgi:hypothetical protein
MIRNRGNSLGGFLKAQSIALSAGVSAPLTAFPGKRWRIFTGATQVYLNYDAAASATTIPLPTNSTVEIGDGTFAAGRVNLFCAGALTVWVECYEV